MGDDNGRGIIICVIVVPLIAAVLAAVAVPYQIGWVDGREAERANAIKAGVAQWQANPTTGERLFVYKGSK